MNPTDRSSYYTHSEPKVCQSFFLRFVAKLVPLFLDTSLLSFNFTELFITLAIPTQAAYLPKTIFFFRIWGHELQLFIMLVSNETQI